MSELNALPGHVTYEKPVEELTKYEFSFNPDDFHRSLENQDHLFCVKIDQERTLGLHPHGKTIINEKDGYKFTATVESGPNSDFVYEHVKGFVPHSPSK